MSNIILLYPEAAKKANIGSFFGKTLPGLAARKDFVGGLTAPIVRAFGRGQKLLGNIQKTVPQIKNLNKPLAESIDTPMYQKGLQNIEAGSVLRNQTRLGKLFSKNPDIPLSYRLGRGLGTLGIGAPLAYAPFNLAEYAGAANADIEGATAMGKQTAADRIKERTEQFSNMSFLDRLQSVWNPEKFTNQIYEDAPELQDLAYSAKNNKLQNPGIMSYLASLNPFLLSQPSDVIRQKTRAALVSLMKEKGIDLTKMSSFNTKAADWRTSAIGKGISGLRSVISPAWSAGRTANKALKAKIPNAVTSFIPNTSHTPLQNFLSESTFNAAKKPLSTLGKGFLAAGTPMGVYYSYNAGRESVEDQVRQDSAALADMQAINLFNTPGFTGGLGRLLAALAPSIVGGGINDAAGNILGTNQAPQTGQQVQSLYTD